jgi:hypothetical protein
LFSLKAVLKDVDLKERTAASGLHEYRSSYHVSPISLAYSASSPGSAHLSLRCIGRKKRTAA